MYAVCLTHRWDRPKLDIFMLLLPILIKKIYHKPVNLTRQRVACADGQHSLPEKQSPTKSITLYANRIIIQMSSTSMEREFLYKEYISNRIYVLNYTWKTLQAVFRFSPGSLEVVLPTYWLKVKTQSEYTIEL